MRTIVIIAIASLAFAPCAAVAEGIAFRPSVGQDNAYLCQSGQCFFAVGGGINILGYERAVGTKGSILDLALHGTVLVKATGSEAGTLVGVAVNLDVVKLMTGTGVKIFIPELSCVIGPVVAYDVTKGSVAYGGLVNFNYRF